MTSPRKTLPNIEMNNALSILDENYVCRCGNANCKKQFVDATSVPVNYLLQELQGQLPYGVSLIEDPDVIKKYLRTAICHENSNECVRDGGARHSVSFLPIIPKGIFAKGYEPSVNPSVSADVLSLCSCVNCKNHIIFPLADAYQSVSLIEDPDFRYVKFSIGDGFSVQLPFSTKSDLYLYSIKFKTDRKMVEHEFKNMNKVLSRLDKMRKGLRHVEILFYKNRFSSGGNAENNTPLLSIRVKRDHANRLVFCLYKAHDKVRVMIPVQYLVTALRVVNSVNVRTNEDYAYRLLKGPKLTRGNDPGMALNKRYPVFPWVEPLIEMSKQSPLLEPALKAVLRCMPSNVISIILSYYSGDNVAVTGPLRDLV